MNLSNRIFALISFALFTSSLTLCPVLSASDLDDAQQMFLTGKYEEAEAMAAEQVEPRHLERTLGPVC